MNSGATAERVYYALKQQVTGRAFRPGDRLDPAALAEKLSSSVTPVRDALHLLAGEGLVVTRAGEGFHLPSLHEPGLIDLYAWTSEVLLMAVRAWPNQSITAGAPAQATGATLADRTAALFANIAALSVNAEHALAVSALNARLHAVRLVEPHVTDGGAGELEEIEAALSGRDGRALRALLSAYHRRRRRRAAEIVRAAYRAAQIAEHGVQETITK